jgi:hypothetical protein
VESVATVYSNHGRFRARHKSTPGQPPKNKPKAGMTKVQSMGKIFGF